MLPGTTTHIRCRNLDLRLRRSFFRSRRVSRVPAGLPADGTAFRNGTWRTGNPRLRRTLYAGGGTPGRGASPDRIEVDLRVCAWGFDREKATVALRLRGPDGHYLRDAGGESPPGRAGELVVGDRSGYLAFGESRDLEFGFSIPFVRLPAAALAAAQTLRVELIVSVEGVVLYEAERVVVLRGPR